MARKFLASVLLLLLAANASAQQPLPPASQIAPPSPGPVAPPRAGSDWGMLQALPVGTTLYVNERTIHAKCKLKSAAADTLTCSGKRKDAVYPRSEVVTIKIAHRGRSALEAAIPGGVLMVGGAVGLATEGCSGEIFCGLGFGIVLAGGAAVAIIGASIGAATNFSKSTIYTAP